MEAYLANGLIQVNPVPTFTLYSGIQHQGKFTIYFVLSNTSPNFGYKIPSILGKTLIELEPVGAVNNFSFGTRPSFLMFVDVNYTLHFQGFK